MTRTPIQAIPQSRAPFAWDGSHIKVVHERDGEPFDGGPTEYYIVELPNVGAMENRVYMHPEVFDALFYAVPRRESRSEQ